MENGEAKAEMDGLEEHGEHWVRHASWRGQVEILLQAPEWKTAKDPLVVSRAVAAVMGAMDYGEKESDERIIKLEVRRDGLAVLLQLAIPGDHRDGKPPEDVAEVSERIKRAFLWALNDNAAADPEVMRQKLAAMELAVGQLLEKYNYDKPPQDEAFYRRLMHLCRVTTGIRPTAEPYRAPATHPDWPGPKETAAPWDPWSVVYKDFVEFTGNGERQRDADAKIAAAVGRRLDEMIAERRKLPVGDGPWKVLFRLEGAVRKLPTAEPVDPGSSGAVGSLQGYTP